MTIAGYSGTPLMKKLGITLNTKVLLINAPDNYYELVEANLTKQLCRENEIPDLIHLFVTGKQEFEDEMRILKPLRKRNRSAAIWISWYKKSSGIPTDITEDIIRNYALKNGLVDIKVCAVSEIWSGLKLVVPKNKR
jgi:hypothetical protein